MRNARLLTILLVALVVLLCQGSKAHAEDMGTAFTYQGRLIDGEHVADSPHDFQFKLFDSVEDGNQIGSDVNIPGVDVIEGYFTVALDFGSGIFNGESRWLQIGVRPGEPEDTNGYTVLDPRQEVTPAPYAIYAKNTTGVTVPLILSGSSSDPILDVTNSGTGYSISAIAEGTTGRGVYGYASGAGNNFGGYFVADGIVGRGVLGEANGNSGVGVRGKTSGSEGCGVYGSATGIGPVTNYGGYFEADGGQGRGVYGSATNDNPVENYGGYFEANGGQGRGVYGIATSTSPGTHYGGYFESGGSNGRGVLGIANGDNGVGVRGTTSGSDGKAVHGIAGNDGADFENFGGYFTAAGGTGKGVFGKANGDNGVGVLGKADGDNGVGVRGSTSGSYGKAVHGVAGNDESGSENYGGYFRAEGELGIGVYAEASGSSGKGVYAEASGGFATGVHAVANGNYAIAIRAVSEDGTAILANGKVSVKGNIEIKSETDGSTIIELGEGLDYAEGFDVTTNPEIKPGSVLVIDPENPGKLMLSHSYYDTKVAGIVAGANGLGSGVKLGSEKFDHDVALSGRVYCNVDATEAGIEPGDLLTTSDLPGYAMKVTDNTCAQGAILGKAMEKLEKGKKGQILVLVTLQ